MASRGLTDISIRNLKPGSKRREIPDRGGLFILVQPSGRKGFCVRYRFHGTSRKLTLQPGITLAAARKLAAAAMLDVAEGRDPSKAKQAAKQRAADAAKDTLRAVCEGYLKREGKNLRSVAARESILERLVYGKLGNRPVDAIERIEIARLLDKIEDEKGARAADMTLAVLRRVFNWHAARSNRFSSPIVRGMARCKPKERARHRVLADDELRSVWRAAEEISGPFSALVRFLLLTGARRSEASAMRWGEIEDTIWTLPSSRNKAKVDLSRALSKAALALLDEQPRFVDCPYVFTTDGKHPISGFSRFKRRLDQASGTTGWALHDLLRTARSLMSRAGVPSDHAERCLGHVIGGVRETYDRHRYLAEMLAAYKSLAALIERIVDPQQNVVALRH
jgi:integrase